MSSNLTSNAARVLGSISTPRKRVAVIKNGAKTQFQRRAIETFICNCDGGESMKPAAHKTTCHRGRVLRRRAKTEARRAS